MRKQESKQKSTEAKETAGGARPVQSRRSRVQFHRECIQIVFGGLFRTQMKYGTPSCPQRSNMSSLTL